MRELIGNTDNFADSGFVFCLYAALFHGDIAGQSELSDRSAILDAHPPSRPIDGHSNAHSCHRHHRLHHPPRPRSPARMPARHRRP